MNMLSEMKESDQMGLCDMVTSYDFKTLLKVHSNMRIRCLIYCQGHLLSLVDFGRISLLNPS